MDEQERFDEICKPCFDELKKGNAEIIALLKGKNGDPGLLDDMRIMKKVVRGVIAAGVFIVCGFGIQIIHSAWGWITSLFQRQL